MEKNVEELNNSEDSHYILIADHDERIRRLLKTHLEKENYIVDEANNGKQALKLALERDYDLVISALMLPEKDGLEVTEKIRREKDTPILILTSKGEESDRIQGFEKGADDYVVKPFSPREVVLRVRAILRRYKTHQTSSRKKSISPVITLPPLKIDKNSRRITADGKVVTLTPKEFDLLYYLMSNPDQIFGREQLLKEVWKYEFFGDLRTVDTHIKRLREKLKKKSVEASKMIETVWGLGYKLSTHSDEESAD